MSGKLDKMLEARFEVVMSFEVSVSIPGKTEVKFVEVKIDPDKVCNLLISEAEDKIRLEKSNEVPPKNKELTATELKVFEAAPVATFIVNEFAVESNATFNPALIEYPTKVLSEPTLKKVFGLKLLNFKEELTSNVIKPFENIVSAFDLKKSVSAKPLSV
jgi:hypothetical protein